MKIQKLILALLLVLNCNILTVHFPNKQNTDSFALGILLLQSGIQSSIGSTGTGTSSSTSTSTDSTTSTGSVASQSSACNSHPDNEHLIFGNPSCSLGSDENYLLLKTQYVVSYNNGKGIANWVSWHLQDTWIGSTPRQDDFREDPTLPAGFNIVQETDYSGSGFDRGHLCPSADRTDSVESNSATFLMTNMIPQAPNNNRQTWRILEDYERDLVSQGKELYVIAGTYGKGGAGSDGYSESIGINITVPERT